MTNKQIKFNLICYFHGFIITPFQMRLRFSILFTALSFYPLLAQETFYVNGVAEDYEPIHAFSNAHIILDPNNEIENGTLIIQGDKIISVDTGLNIPIGATLIASS